MAYGPALVVMALILFTAAADAKILSCFRSFLGVGKAKWGHPSPLSALNLTGINVTGRLCCNGNGNCPIGSSGAAGVGGALVFLNCTNLAGASIQVGQGTTNVNGTFNINVPNLEQILGNILTLNGLVPCDVRVPLPLKETACPIINTTLGYLNGVPSILTCVTHVVSGLSGELTVPEFILNKATVGF